MISRRLQREKEKRKLKKIFKNIIVVLIIYIIFNIGYGFYKEDKVRTALEEQEKRFEIQKVIKIDNTPVAEKQVEYIIDDTYMEHNVSAKLEIPKINLETYILESFSNEAMDVSPTKYAGPDANEVGNFCVVGHNYKKENMFSGLINLDVGDELFLTDNKNGKFRYTIYDIYKVRPTNLEPLEQDTQGKREVTLISCVNYADLRIIVKAREAFSTAVD